MASSGDGIGRDLQFWQTHGDTGLDGLGDDRWGWSGWYRLYSQGRYNEQKAAKIFLGETAEHPCAQQIDPDEVQVLGPFVREGLPEVPLFLFVVKGMHRKVGKKKPHYKHRKPSFYLVSAAQIDGQWQLPLPVETLLAWLWQRWELEVAHREMKSGFGVGEKQCWNPRATIASVQWSVWVYALLLLSAYRSWGLLNASPIPTRWWHGAKHWSFNTLWRQYRSALWGTTQFRTLWTRTPDNWLKKESFLVGLSNSIAASTRI